jgi:hypothetical protein
MKVLNQTKSRFRMIKFDNLIKVSSNKIYAGMHWRKRAKLKEDYLLLTNNVLRAITPIEKKVSLDFTFYFKSRTLDSSNCFFMAKMIEDCMVSKGILKDDTIKYVQRVSVESKKGDSDYCELVIK